MQTEHSLWLVKPATEGRRTGNYDYGIVQLRKNGQEVERDKNGNITGQDAGEQEATDAEDGLLIWAQGPAPTAREALMVLIGTLEKRGWTHNQTMKDPEEPDADVWLVIFHRRSFDGPAIKA